MDHLGQPCLHHGAWTVYRSDELSDSDCRYSEYNAMHGVTGEVRRLDVTGYGPPQPEMFKAIIDLGFPTRHDVRGRGPLRPDDVIMLLRAHMQVAA